MVFAVTRNNVANFSTDYSHRNIYPGAKLTSGSICIKEGVWKNENYQIVVNVSKGDIMPWYNNKEITWTLTDYSLATKEQKS